MSHPFLVIFTARSGSTALFGNLKSHPDFKMRAEVFGNAVLPGDIEQTDDNRLEFLRKFWQAYKDGAQPENEIFRGFKMQVTRNGDQFSDLDRLVEFVKPYQPRIITLRRQNILKQALSSINARRLQIATAKMLDGRAAAHVTPDIAAVLKDLKAQKLVVNVKELGTMLAGIKKAYGILNALSDKMGETHDITYEDYNANRDSVVKSVFSYIGADPEKWAPADAYLKITSDDLSEVVENYDELQRFAHEAGYGSML
ncbi:MAG: Stf0 family sulfotransferase [Pseudomonadota bacterium]